jgi:radical SAM protein with 4Fe4S-binding SPASM domain
MGIRPNGDVTPCPYLPVFGGNLEQESLSDIWNHSKLFLEMRDRRQLGGRCGTCELNSYCGGCRARAFGLTGDYRHEDPLCSFQPGPLVEAVRMISPQLEYGHSVVETIRWDGDARARIENVPAFVRGMVVKRVEEYCRRKGLEVVTVDELQEIRSRMPVGKMFRKSRSS